MRPLLLYNHSGYENRGCEAIVESTAALFESRVPSLTVASDTPDYDRAHGRHHFIDSKIAPYSLDRFINSIAFRLGQSRDAEISRLYAPVIRAGAHSICLSVGGDTYCYAYQEHMHYINRRLKEKHAPLVLWGCSIDPDRVRDDVLEDLRAYDLIVPRESVSAAVLEGKGFPVARWIDPAFTLEPKPAELPSGWQEDRMIGLNVSPLVVSKSKDHDKALNSIYAVMDMILAETDNSIALIPHVTWKHDNDMELLSALAAHYQGDPRVVLVPGTYSAQEYKYFVSKLRALVTARTHLSVAAYSTGVPTFVIGYSVKARGIARDIYGDETGHLFPAQQLEAQAELLNAVGDFLQHLPGEQVYLRERMQMYISGGDTIVNRVLSLSDGGTV
ncbi:MAG: polysaccharide pyruvyl transferase family protein [Clostridia bacterium]|nr:polysaccharide pyruvyl transferase family protein [Clostridia bacterium]